MISVFFGFWGFFCLFAWVFVVVVLFCMGFLDFFFFGFWFFIFENGLLKTLSEKLFAGVLPLQFFRTSCPLSAPAFSCFFPILNLLTHGTFSIWK